VIESMIMKRFLTALLVVGASTSVTTAADTASTPLPSLSELRENGAFAFPQKDAKVLYDGPDLRFSVWNNAEYLFAQAIAWTEGPVVSTQTNDTRFTMDDWSVFMLDMDADQKVTYRIDRTYLLNSPIGLKGLLCSIELSEKSITTLMNDSNGRGGIRHMETSNGKKVRVDTYLIPLEEIHRHLGDKIRVSYSGFSPKTLLNVNSAGVKLDPKDIDCSHIPFSKYHDYVFTTGAKIDATQVPEDRPEDRQQLHGSSLRSF
jgi:hypothetical protein